MFSRMGRIVGRKAERTSSAGKSPNEEDDAMSLEGPVERNVESRLDVHDDAFQAELGASNNTLKTMNLSSIRSLNPESSELPEPSSNNEREQFKSSLQEFGKGLEQHAPSLESVDSLDLSETEGMTESNRGEDGRQRVVVQLPKDSTKSLTKADRLKANNNQRDSLASSHSNGDSTLTSHKPLFRELVTVPSQRSWKKPVDVRKPRSILRRLRLLAGRIVEQPSVQLGIIFLIIINAILMGIATFDFVTDDPRIDHAFSATDKAFLVVFTIELGLQMLYRSVSLFTDGWLVFDFVIIILSWSLESLQVVRAFRIFRAFRLVTRLGPLRELVMAIGNVMPRIYAIGMLLLLIFYIFAVLFTELFSDLPLSGNYFSTLDASLFTCMELMTLEWAAIARETMAQKTWAWLPFLTFISITGFIVFNLVVAVICDAVKVVDDQCRQERERDENGVVDLTDKGRLDLAQERIYELTEQVESLRNSHKELNAVVALLTKELCQSFNANQEIVFDNDEHEIVFDGDGASDNDAGVDRPMTLSSGTFPPPAT